MIGTLKIQDSKWVIQRTNGEIYPLHKDDYSSVNKILQMTNKASYPVEFTFKSDRYGILIYGYLTKVINQNEFREHILNQLIN